MQNDVILGCSCVALSSVRASVVAPVSINVKALQVVVVVVVVVFFYKQFMLQSNGYNSS